MFERNLPKVAIFTGVGFVLAAVISFLVVYRANSQTAAFFCKPFIAQKIESVFSDGDAAKPVKQVYFTIARRSDGSETTVLAINSPRGESGQATEINDARRGRSVTLEPFTRSVTTFYYPANKLLEGIRSEATACGMATTSRTEPIAILGYHVSKVMENTFDRWESLVAPGLNCYPLQQTITFRDGGRNERKVTIVIEGEPPDYMFDIPSGYIERSPSQVSAAYGAKFPGHTLWSPKTLQTLDKRYYNQR